jgi:hypothetical protein
MVSQHGDRGSYNQNSRYQSQYGKFEGAQGQVQQRGYAESHQSGNHLGVPHGNGNGNSMRNSGYSQSMQYQNSTVNMRGTGGYGENGHPRGGQQSKATYTVTNLSVRINTASNDFLSDFNQELDGVLSRIANFENNHGIQTAPPDNFSPQKRSGIGAHPSRQLRDRTPERASMMRDSNHRGNENYLMGGTTSQPMRHKNQNQNQNQHNQQAYRMHAGGMPGGYPSTSEKLSNKQMGLNLGMGIPDMLNMRSAGSTGYFNPEDLGLYKTRDNFEVQPRSRHTLSPIKDRLADPGSHRVYPELVQSRNLTRDDLVGRRTLGNTGSSGFEYDPYSVGMAKGGGGSRMTLDRKKDLEEKLMSGARLQDILGIADPKGDAGRGQPQARDMEQNAQVGGQADLGLKAGEEFDWEDGVESQGEPQQHAKLGGPRPGPPAQYMAPMQQ